MTLFLVFTGFKYSNTPSGQAQAHKGYSLCSQLLSAYDVLGAGDISRNNNS